MFQVHRLNWNISVDTFHLRAQNCVLIYAEPMKGSEYVGQHSQHEEAINSRCASNAETAIKTRYQEWGRWMKKISTTWCPEKKVPVKKIKSCTNIILLMILNKKK